MNTHTPYQLLADIILLLHLLFVAFVILGLVLIVAGTMLRWPLVKNFWFRIGHLLAIVVVVLQAWADRFCPLTIWESNLREAAGGVAYSGTFVQHWVHKLIYYDIPLEVFALIYTVFGLLVLAAWIVNPPKLPHFRFLCIPTRERGNEKP